MKTIRLRPGVHYVSIEGGVYFSSARATFVVRGPDVLYRVVDTCLPLLEDGTDIDELVAAIGTPAARKLISHLVATLDSRGLLLHLDQLLVPEPGAAARERFREALAYLETHRDDPYADFQRIRSARVLLSGPADALGPAARGLLRAGIGHVMVATNEPHRLAALAARHAEVQLLLCHPEDIPALVAGRLPDAAVLFTEDTFPSDGIQRLPAACLAIPVRLGKDLAMVGPAIGSRHDPSAAEQLWSRAVTWCRRDGDDLLVRPSGDLLAGALAGQMALDAIIGLNPGRVHLVHGPDLSSDALTPRLGGPAELDPPIVWPAALSVSGEEPAGLGEVAAGESGESGGLAGARSLGSLGVPAALGPQTERRAPLGEASTAVGGGDWLESVSQRWAGLFRITVPGDLPQMPVAITLAEGRSDGFDGRALGFGPDQEASTTEAAFEALRQHCSAPAHAGEHGPGRSSVGAAGRDETRWLLDGALRLLAQQLSDGGGAEGPASSWDWLGIDNAEARRLWRALEEHELTPVRLAGAQVAGFGWTLVTVHERRTGARLAAGWGPSREVGAVAALSAAVATVQVRRTIDAAFPSVAAEPGFLDHLHGPYADPLAAEMQRWLGATGRRLTGRRLSRDAVTGPLGVWCGAVRIDG